MSDGEWVLIALDEILAKRQGLPTQVPVPKAEFEGLAEKGLPIANVRKWVTAFMGSPLARSGQWRSANGALAARLQAFTGKAEFWERAQKAFEKNDFPGAIAALRMVTRVDANDHAAKMNLASALANTGAHADALKIYEEITPTFVGDADFFVTLAHVHLNLGDQQKAAEHLATALEADPGNKAAMDAMVKLGVLVPIYEDPHDAGSLVYLRADALLPALEETWDAAPRTAAYYLDQMVYHEADHRPAIALAAAERALGASPSPKEEERARVAHATALRTLGRGAEAEAEVRAQLEKTPDAVWALVELGACLRAQGKKDEANEALDRALAITPGDQLALSLRFWPDTPGDVQAVGEAIPALAEFAAKHPNDAGVLWSLARAKVAVGSDDEARDTFARAVALAPDDDDLRAEQWAELGRQRKLDEIIAESQKLGDLGKRSWKLRWNEAEAYSALGKKLEARACFSAINHDESLSVDVRKKARRAVRELEQRGTNPTGPLAVARPVASR